MSPELHPWGRPLARMLPHDCAAAHDRLCIDLIRRHLSTETVGQRILLYGGVSSTNVVLRGLAARGAVDGTVVLAEQQAQGRGRRGRTWFSPPGLNLYTSVLFRPPCELREAPLFSLIASLALIDAIRAEGLPAMIKWPNDALVNRRKVAGTLVETAAAGGRLRHLIIGVGVNLNVADEALTIALHREAGQATSLREAAGREIDRNLFAAAFFNELEKWFRLARAREWNALLRAWRERDGLRGHRVEIRGPGPAWQGLVRGADAEGYLEVETQGGVLQRVIGGEVLLLD